MRAYVGDRVYMAYRMGSSIPGLQFDWVDWEYLGVTEAHFRRAVDLRVGEDWNWKDGRLEPARGFLAAQDERAVVAEVERSALRTGSGHAKDVFICHAGEDKATIARPLAKALEAAGLTVWYDEYELQIGDKLRRAIESGLSRSRFGLVILSPHFFQKEWPQRELDALFTLEGPGVRILPVWHHLGREEVVARSPILADRVAVRSTDGIDTIVKAVCNRVRGS